MAHQLHIIADTTIMGPQYGAKHYAGVLLSAGIKIDAGLPPAPDVWKKLVQPWMWNAVHGFKLAYRDPNSASPSWQIFTTPCQPGTAPSLGDLDKRLTAHADWIIQQSGNDTTVFEIEGQGEQYWLPGFIADVSRWPAPIGRGANAAFVVELPAKIDGRPPHDYELLLCPVVTIDGQRLDPDPAGLSADGTRWSYVATASAICRMQAASAPAKKTAEQLIDLQSQWVFRPPRRDTELAWFGKDYWLELPQRVAGALDPLTAMIGIWRRALSSDSATLKGWLATTAGRQATFETFIRAATDSLMCSSRPASDGYTLLQLVLKAQAEESKKVGLAPPDPAAVTSFATAIRALETTAPTWPSLKPVLQAFLDADHGKLLGQAKEPDVSVLTSAGERLLQALGSRETAAGFVLTLWKAAADTSPPAAAHLESMKRHARLTASAALQQVDVGRRLALAAGPDDLEHLPPIRLWENDARANYAAALADRIKAKLSLPTSPEAAELGKSVAAYAAATAARILPPSAPANAGEDWQRELGDPSPTEAPHNLTFQIDWVASAKEEDKQKTADILRRVAGFGVLLRPAADDADLANPGTKFLPWRCLNMATCAIADTKFKPEQGGELSNPLVVENLLVPKVVGFGAGLSQSTVTYDNAGLIAQDSSAEFDGVLHDDEYGRPLLRYVTARDSAGKPVEWGRLPYLRFGQVYEAATFVVLNGGALPSELSRGDPTAFLTKPADVVVDPPSGTVQRVRYVRRVRVNEASISGMGKGRQLAPTIPATKGALRPIADALDSFGRPAGLDQDHPRADYFLVDNGRRGTLDLARDPTNNPGIASEIGVRVLAIDTSDLGTGALEVQIVKPHASGVDKRFALILTRTDQKVVCTPAGVSEAVELTLPGAPGDSLRPLVDLILNPIGIDHGWRLVLRASGRPFDHIDPASSRTGSLAAFRNITIPSTLGDGLSPGQSPAWNGVGIRVELTGAAQRVSFGRPAVRVGGSWQNPEAAADPPLVLLGPGDASKEARVRLPSVDMATFDRWVAMDALRPNDSPTARTRRLTKWRVDAIVRHEEIVSSGQKDEAPGEPIDVSIDDPAVEPTMLVELIPIMSAGDIKPPLRREVTLPLKDEKSTPPDPLTWALDNIRCRPLELVIKRDGVAALEPLELPNQATQLTVKVPKGQIWELRLYPLVDKKWFYPAHGSNLASGLVARFPDLVRDGLPTYGKYVCTAPLRLRIEAVAETMEIDGDVLAQMLTTRFVSPRVEVEWGLDGYEMPLAKISAPGMANKIWDARYDLARFGAVELCRQHWRWDGMLPPSVGAPGPAWPLRPDRLDFDFPFDDQGKQTVWARANFARRDPNDFVREPRVAVGLPFVRTSLYRRDMSGDARASVHRFAAAAIDRYEQITPGSKPTWAGGPANSVAPPFFKLLLVHCRRIEPVPKPAFKLIVPLTRAAADGKDGEPGLLVVLSEPWGEIGGVAEALEWRVETASNDEYTLQEAGPDPALHSLSFAGTSKDIIRGRRYELRFEGRGPIGHSYDSTLGSVQKIVSTSFVLEPKLLIDGKPATRDDKRKLPWSFAKIAFRRVLIPGGVEAAASRDPATLASKWTAGEWHQMLPDASRFIVAERGKSPAANAIPLNLSLSRFALRFAQDGLHFVDTDTGQDIDIVPWPSASGGNIVFGLVILVTERVFDAAGRRSSERYRALLEWDGMKLATIDGALPVGKAQDAIVARLVEVQWLAKPAPSTYPRVRVDKTFWEDLLPQDRVGETRTRIVRISRPVGSSSR
ncbi:MAG: hypothetical protein ABL904_01725 [Hyphomicrobiaceae bacterium]